MKSKKGQIAVLQGVIVSIIIIGILIGAAFLMLEEFLGQDNFLDTGVTVTNETGGYINETGYTVDSSTVREFQGLSVTAARNSTSGQTILVGNYSVDSSTGVITNATTTTWSNVEFDYTYTTVSDSWVGVNDTITALITIPTLLGLIILILIIGIVLAVIFNVIPGSRVSGA
jgi:hypothetical protein